MKKRLGLDRGSSRTHQRPDGVRNPDNNSNGKQQQQRSRSSSTGGRKRDGFVHHHHHHKSPTARLTAGRRHVKRLFCSHTKPPRLIEIDENEEYEDTTTTRTTTTLPPPVATTSPCGVYESTTTTTSYVSPSSCSSLPQVKRLFSCSSNNGKANSAIVEEDWDWQGLNHEQAVVAATTTRRPAVATAQHSCIRNRRSPIFQRVAPRSQEHVKETSVDNNRHREHHYRNHTNRSRPTKIRREDDDDLSNRMASLQASHKKLSSLNVVNQDHGCYAISPTSTSSKQGDYETVRMMGGLHQRGSEDQEKETSHRDDHHHVGTPISPPRIARQDNPTIRIALQASQKALHEEDDQCHTDARLPSTGMSSEPHKTAVTPPPVAAAKETTTSEALDERGNALFAEGNLNAAFTNYEQALKMKYNALKVAGDDVSEEERARILASVATSINNLTYLRQVRNQGSAQDTLANYEMSLKIKRDILGPDHLSVGKTLNNIGSVHYFLRDWHAAFENYEQARDILQIQLGTDHLDVSTVTSNLGDVHASLGQFSRAVHEYRAALELRWKQLGPNDPKVVRLLEQIASLEMKLNTQGQDFDNVSNISTSESQELNTDMHQLQVEIQDDLKFFDDLASSAHIDMIKDQVGMFQDIRKLNTHDDTTETTAVSTEDPTHPHDDRTAPVEKDFHLENKKSPHLSSSESPSRKDVRFMPVVEGGHKIDNENSPEESAVAIAVPLSPKSQLQTSTPSHLHVHPASPVSPLSSSTYSSVPLSPRRSPATRLTTEERQQALASVKDRLAKLRANRASRAEAATTRKETDVTASTSEPQSVRSLKESSDPRRHSQGKKSTGDVPTAIRGRLPDPRRTTRTNGVSVKLTTRTASFE